LPGAELKKIIFVNTKSCVWGGVERYIQTIVPIISRLGYSVSALFEEKPDYEDSFIDDFEEVIYFENIEKTIQAIKDADPCAVFIHKIGNPELLKALQQSFFTVFFVHDHDYYCFRRHKYFPVVRKNCTYANNFFYCSLCSGMINKVFGKIRPVNVIQKQKMFRLVKNSNHFMVLSEHMKRNLLINGFKADSISKIYPVKENSTEENESSGNRILFAGQIIRGKGLDLLLEALSKVKKPFHLDVIGKGDDEENIRKTVSELKLNGRITFHGWVNDPAAFFKNAALVVFPSRWQEPFGLVGIEAFSFKKPVVAFDVGGVGEWLKNGENGYLIEPFDTYSMAAKIEFLLSNPKQCARMGANGAQFLEKNCSQAGFAGRFTEMMEKLIV